ncbi:hypothetical protein O181_055507 [Austropuccinia psidii MF-1]|uniref:CCHC-type domain-containing protein n=1 Tax=Austropuccinia psidii MF-1 TaxID=1389203 RepID=A0A9Q3EDT8_9BASI|nr:hypothetical protein [Austropuccinia psidii MF-1]
MQMHITPAINTLMATNTNLKVHPDDLLNMILQISTASSNSDHGTEISQVKDVSKFGSRQPSKRKVPQHNFSQQHHRYTNNQASSSRDLARTPSLKYPCHYCGEVGHWLPNCPTRLKAYAARNRARGSGVNVASLGVVPLLEDTEGLIESGATHSALGSF